MEKYLIGIDIGQYSIKAVKIERSDGRIDILDFVIKEFGSESSDEVKQSLLKEVLEELGTAESQVYSLVSGQDIVLKRSIVPFMPKEDLRDAVRWSLKEVTNFNLDESKIDLKILNTITGSDGIKRNEILAVAVHNTLIDRHVKSLQAAGVEPAFITISHFALANLIAQKEQEMVQKVSAVIDIGLNKTNILIFKGATLQFIRKITTASDSFTRALSGVVVTFPKKIELDAKKAEEIKRECGIPAKSQVNSSFQDIPLSQISVLMRPILERLLTDIRSSFRYFREEFQVDAIDQVFLAGGGANLKNLTDFVSDGLGGIPTKLITLPSNITSKIPKGKDLSNILPTLAASIGVCLGKGDTVDLLPKSVKIQKTIGIQQKILRIIAPVLLVLMIFSFLSMTVQLKRYQKILTSYNDYYSNLVKLRTLRDNIIERQRFFKEIIGTELELFVYLKELSRIIPRSIEFLDMEFFKKEAVFFIRGLSFASGDSAENYLADFLLKLENSPYFNNVNLLLTIKEEIDQLEAIDFKLTVELSKIE
ncbi:MAG: pilus assembly protein PilM [Candidatus Omnitrophica bacterium]|nr:pilus assembly protein PilM [Candidatus Omnitrophota bacterium]